MSARNGGRMGWNSSSLKRDLSGSIQVRSNSAGTRGRRRLPVTGKALAAAGVRSPSGAMEQPIENQPYPDRLNERPPTARSRSASVQRQQHLPPQPQPSASHTPANSFYTSAPTDAPAAAPPSQRHVFQYNATQGGGYQGGSAGSAPPRPAIGSRKRSSSSCSLPPPTPPVVPSTPIRGASPMRNSTSGTVGGSIVPQHQSSQRPYYDKYNYSTLRDTSPMRGASPHKSIRNPSPSRRHSQPIPQQESPVAPATPPAPTSDAWERLVALAKDDFSPEELAMLYWDTLSRLLSMYGITEPMEVARIEITWKEIQAVRSAIDNPSAASHQQQQIIVAPPPGPGRGSRDTHTKQSYTPFTYTFKRDTPLVARNTISGTPIVTPQQELEARRQSATGTMRSSSPAQRPWM